MNEDASGKKSGGVDGGVKVPVAVAVNGSGGGEAKANGKVVGNGGQENGTAATTTTTLEKRKTTLEKRVRESSGVSSSSGECTSGESRAAADEAYGGGEDENNEAGSKDQKADEDGDLNMQPESANEDEGKQNGHFGAAIENGGGKPKLPRPSGTVECPRCNSKDTKFCYYNNYNIKQPRYFCKSCQRYWTSGGTLRNVPVGAGRRKHKSSSKNHDKFNKTELAGLGKNGPLATAADLVVGFTTAGLPQCVNNKSYAAVAALKPQVATLKPPQLVSQDGGTTPSRSRSKKKSKSSIPLHHPVANGSQDQLQQRNAAYAAQQAYAANAGFAQLWQQMLQMNSQRNGWNSVMPAGQAGLLVPQTGGTNQQASAQPPWWYTQMVNNLSAANPAAQLRSFQFQNQHEQEENRQ